MSEHEAFLQGILQHPDEDAPRAVYADWLEEHSDPRGEFIRVQCELSGKAIGHLIDWPGLERLNLLHLWINHGIGDTAAIQLAASPRVAKLLHLDLGYTDLTAKGVRALTKSTTLSRLRHLNLEGNPIGDAGVTTLVKSPVVAGLRTLILARTGMKDTGAKAILDSPHLTHLRQVKLNGNKLKLATRSALEERFGPGVCQFGQQ